MDRHGHPRGGPLLDHRRGLVTHPHRESERYWRARPHGLLPQGHRSAWTLGTALQVTEDQWPPTRADFGEYWKDGRRRVVIDGPVGRYLSDLINLRMINPVLGLPFRPLQRFFTAGFLAPVFRDALGMRRSPGRQLLFEWLFLLVASVNRFLPVFIRQGGSHILLADVRRRVRARSALVSPPMLTSLRRLLSRKISVEAMIEFAMRLAIPYLATGIAWTFLNVDDVARVETRLSASVPAGADLAALGVTTPLWPFPLFGHEICPE